jgi:hypothetical protein
MPIEQTALWVCDGIGCKRYQTFSSDQVARVSGWMKTKFNVFCPDCVAKLSKPAPTIAGRMD